MYLTLVLDSGLVPVLEHVLVQGVVVSTAIATSVTSPSEATSARTTKSTTSTSPAAEVSTITTVTTSLEAATD